MSIPLLNTKFYLCILLPPVQFMTSEHQYISRKDEGDRIIVFERGDLVFVFNFHWCNSYSDYRIGCFKPGKYKVCFSSSSFPWFSLQ